MSFNDLNNEERAALHAELDASLAEAEASKPIDAEEVMGEIPARRT